MNSKKSIVALAGSAALLAGVVIAASAASASESEPKIAPEYTGSVVVPAVSASESEPKIAAKFAGSSTIASKEASVVPSAAELEGYANCMTEAGFKVSVFEGGILGAVVDASKDGWDSAELKSKDGWDSAKLKCAEENFDK